MSKRQFTHEKAVRAHVPLLISLIGPSGSGKTYSALRIASGIQKVSGGDVMVIDTENKRSTHYAGDFDFQHVDFQAPFSPEDYLAAIEHCVGSGAKTVVIDSMSHEHEGPGGVLEMHDAVLDRMAGNDYRKRNACSFTAWGQPKAARRRLINTVLQLGCNLVMCFRAKEKLKPVKGGEPKKRGWMAIGGDEYNFEATARFLLRPSCNGVPALSSDMEGEQETIKIPRYFEDLFSKPEQLSEAHGEAMARWASGSPEVESEEYRAFIVEITRAPDLAELDAITKGIKASGGSLSATESKKLRAAFAKAKKALSAEAPMRQPGEDG